MENRQYNGAIGIIASLLLIMAKMALINVAHCISHHRYMGGGAGGGQEIDYEGL